MIDLSHIPETPGLRVFLPQGVDGNSWQAWQKPRGFVMATIYAIGPGGGGGSGRAATVASATIRGGGGGGGSGGLSRLTIPLFLLPDTLYIRVTPGGSGGASVAVNNNGTAGNVAFSPSPTLVAVYPSSGTQYLFLLANAGNGAAGGSTVAVVAGSAGLISANTDAPLSNLGATLFIAGNGGANGSIGAGASIAQGTASQIYGGAGGAGAPASSNLGSAGGDISALASTPFIASPGGATGLPPTAGGAGFSWSTIFPLKYYGGTGGASRGNSDGAAGGNGSVPGTGGGGGGGGGITSGRGGGGGPGCVIIQCW